MKLLEDGNIIGRVGALAALGAVGVFPAGICGGDFCPIASKSSGCCFSSSAE